MKCHIIQYIYISDKKKSYLQSIGPRFVDDRLTEEQKVLRQTFQQNHLNGDKIVVSASAENIVAYILLYFLTALRQYERIACHKPTQMKWINTSGWSWHWIVKLCAMWRMVRWRERCWNDDLMPLWAWCSLMCKDIKRICCNLLSAHLL